MLKTKQKHYHGIQFAFYFILFSAALLSILLCKTLTVNRCIRLPPSSFAFPIIAHLPHQSFHALSQRYGPLIHLHAPYWRFMRRISMHELLSAKNLDQLSPVRHEELLKMVEGLYEKSKQGASLDAGQDLMKFTNNAISRVALGRRCSGQRGEAEEARRIVEETTELVDMDYVGVLRYFDVQVIDRRVRDLHERHDRMMEELSGVKDLLDILLDVAEVKTFKGSYQGVLFW